MSISVDIGTSRLRSLRNDGDELVARGVPASFALVDDNPAARDLLTRADVGFAVGENELALVGEAALRHAAVFRATPLRLMPGGLVPTDDPPVRQMLGMLFESLLPEADTPGALCGLILPDAAITEKNSRDFISRLVWMRGYEPLLLSATQAVSLATLSGTGFTGATLSFGAGACSVGLVHRGREQAFGSVNRGGDAIDEQLAAAERCFTYDTAGQRYLDVEAVRVRREQLTESLTRPTSEFGQRVAGLVRESLTTALNAFGKQLAQERPGPFSGALKMVCTGGVTRSEGFVDVLASVLESLDLPIVLETPQLAPQDDYLVARGGLIHAELEVHCAAA